MELQVTCDFTHRIVDVSAAEVGSMYDVTVLLSTGVLERKTVDARIIGDKSYKRHYEGITPANGQTTKNREKGRLEAESIQRHELETQRACIEQVNKRLKNWAIIKQHEGAHTLTQPGSTPSSAPSTHSPSSRSIIDPCTRALRYISSHPHIFSGRGDTSRRIASMTMARSTLPHMMTPTAFHDRHGVIIASAVLSTTVTTCRTASTEPDGC